MKIHLDRAKCTALGVCESMAPEWFEVNEDGDLDVLVDEVDEGQRERLEEIVRACPTAALSLGD
ncbi:ferredoxin [Kribbia dieselivorans]|uniref:ferredoxin n=1 Tax=Kribbia dieselivorans TaxID=331526 RepID=UPI000837EABB|nr:ferredoxin [Kribbia dieselivorans]